MLTARIVSRESRLIYAHRESTIVRVRTTNKRRRYKPLSRRTIKPFGSQRGKLFRPKSIAFRLHVSRVVPISKNIYSSAGVSLINDLFMLQLSRLRNINGQKKRWISAFLGKFVISFY